MCKYADVRMKVLRFKSSAHLHICIFAHLHLSASRKSFSRMHKCLMQGTLIFASFN